MNSLKPLVFILIILLGFTISQYSIVHKATAGSWPGHPGQNIINIPISWCSLQGSPAVTIHNIPNPPGPPDTTTDKILSSRYERATNDIYQNPAGITLHSAVPSTAQSFPVIADPDPNPIFASRGDVLNPDNQNDSVEYQNIINECQKAGQTNPKAGITAVNIDLFHDTNGNYVFVDGIGGFFENSDGFIFGQTMVSDNHYLFPDVCGSTTTCNFPPGVPCGVPDCRFGLVDPHDQLVGHESGHALGLDFGFDSYDPSGHNTDPRYLMYHIQTSNAGNGQVDNILLNSEEINQIRTFAVDVPGVDQDPAGKILKGDVVETDKVAGIHQANSTVPLYLDISKMKVALNTKQNIVLFGQELFGLIPNNTKNLEYWTLVNTDNNTSTGAGPNMLHSIGVPSTQFKGADLIMKAQVNGSKITGTVWQSQNGTLNKIQSTEFHTNIIKSILMIDYAKSSSGKSHVLSTVPINNFIGFSFNNKVVKIDMNKPFTIQGIALEKELPISSKIDKSKEEHGLNFILSQVH